MGGYAHYLAQKYGRPWLGDPGLYSDAVAATNLAPQFTLFLAAGNPLVSRGAGEHGHAVAVPVRLHA